MALFTMSFSLAHIASSKTGLTIIDSYGYQNWFVMGSLGISRWQAASGCKTRSKEKTIPIVILWRAPLLKGQTNELLTEPLSAMLSGYTLRYGGLLLSLTRHHFQNNTSALKISAPKSTPKKRPNRLKLNI
jgi:hypothetical protein